MIQFQTCEHYLLCYLPRTSVIKHHRRDATHMSDGAVSRDARVVDAALSELTIDCVLKC